MLSADKKVMEASYARGGLLAQNKMVKFYTTGMHGISVASIIALHFVMKSSRANVDDEKATNYRLFLFYGIAATSMIFAILGVITTNICTSFGSVEFLCGMDALDVQTSVGAMRKKHVEALRYFFMTRVCLILQSWTWCIDSGNIPVIVTESVIFAAGLFYMIWSHYVAVKKFATHSDKDSLVFVTSLFAEYGGDVKTTDETKSKSLIVQKHNYGSSNDEVNLHNVEEQLIHMRKECRRQLKAISHEGYVWYRREEENASSFSKSYGVIESGSLFLYHDKDEYESFKKDTLGEENDVKPLRLIRYELETNKKTVEHLQVEYSSLRSSARQLLLGTSALSLMDVMGANFDVEKAAKQYQFCLAESNDSELNFNGAIFLMAEDQKSYNTWIDVLRRTIDCYRDLSNLFSVNKSLALTHDPKAAVAFVHDNSIKRIVAKKEKERHAEEREREEAIYQSIQANHDRAESSQLSGIPLKVLSSVISVGSPASPVLSKFSEEEIQRVERKTLLRDHLSSIECRGTLWTKSLVSTEEPQAHFIKAYAVLKYGKLYFYKTINDFLELGNTYENCAPLILKHYKISTNRSVLNKIKSTNQNMTARKSFRAAMRGTSEMRIRDTVGCNFDYMNAVGNFQMCMLPRTGKKADLTGLEPVVLMAEDRRMYNMWTDGLLEVSGVVEELEAIQAQSDKSAQQRGGTATSSSRFRLTLDAESAVSRSNHQIKTS